MIVGQRVAEELIHAHLDGFVILECRVREVGLTEREARDALEAGRATPVIPAESEDAQEAGDPDIVVEHGDPSASRER